MVVWVERFESLKTLPCKVESFVLNCNSWTVSEIISRVKLQAKEIIFLSIFTCYLNKIAGKGFYSGNGSPKKNKQKEVKK